MGEISGKQLYEYNLHGGTAWYYMLLCLQICLLLHPLCECMGSVCSSYTVWPEILAGNLFWRIGGFESNPPIFHPPKLHSVMSSLLRNHSLCTSGSYIRQSNRRHGVYH